MSMWSCWCLSQRSLLEMLFESKGKPNQTKKSKEKEWKMKNEQTNDRLMIK